MDDVAGAIGWDIGGAHVKLACVSSQGRLTRVEQHACALWRGIEQLDGLLAEIAHRMRFDDRRHIVTMTGEMADLFANRRAGVRAIVAAMLRHVPASALSFYGMDVGLLSPAAAQRRTYPVASANWRITADAVATRCRDGVLVDVGSTTSDIIPIIAGRVRTRGIDDAGRLRHDELIYTGVVRTPVMALGQTLTFRGRRQRIAAEWFATTGDAYLMTGQLERRHYRAATADGAGLSRRDCARRLARMLGCDVDQATLAEWTVVARQVASLQRKQLEVALTAVLARRRSHRTVPVIGAGCGRFIAHELASRLELPYVDFGDLLNIPPRLRDMASVCAPAVAAAMLSEQR